MFHLFKKKKKKETEIKAIEKENAPVENTPTEATKVRDNAKLVDVITVQNSGGFKGYKRVKLATYHEPGCDEMLSKVYRDPDGELGKVTLRLERVAGDGWEAIDVFANDNKIGAFYNHDTEGKRYELYQALINKKFDSLHVRVEDGNTVIASDENNKLYTYERPNSYLFIHLTEQN